MSISNSIMKSVHLFWQARSIGAPDESQESAACPYTAAKDFVSNITRTNLRQNYPVSKDGESPEYPGPGINAVRNLADVMYIGIKGMEKATLFFADSYGPIAR